MAKDSSEFLNLLLKREVVCLDMYLLNKQPLKARETFAQAREVEAANCKER